MRIAHTALWTRDIGSAAEFWINYFGADVGDPYFSKRRLGFISRFVRLPDSADQIELMTGPWIVERQERDATGWDHIAVSLGSKSAVDALADRCKLDGCLASEPRVTGDGFYEAVINMPDGTLVEITD